MKSNPSFTLKNIIPIGNAFFWIPVFVLTGLLSFNALHYYTFSPNYGILPEKVEARQDVVWLISFYMHMGTGVICLFAPLIIFCRKWLNIPMEWHRKLGKTYVLVTLLLVCPTGFYLSIYAKGGLVSQLGFVVQGVLLFIYTYKAFQFAIRQNFQSHATFMIRSYAIGTAALTFRLYHILFYYMDLPYEINYGASQWVSIVGNLFLAELIIAYKAYRNTKYTA